MSAITSWTSNGMDWTNPDPTKKDYWVALSLAAAERQSALGLPSASGTLLDDAYRLCYVSIMNISVNATLFVNHKAYNGTYTATKDFAPAWSYPQIYDFCTDGEYIGVQSLVGMPLNSQRIKRYMRQQYKYFNLLRWKSGFARTKYTSVGMPPYYIKDIGWDRNSSLPQSSSGFPIWLQPNRPTGDIVACLGQDVANNVSFQGMPVFAGTKSIELWMTPHPSYPVTGNPYGVTPTACAMRSASSSTGWGTNVSFGSIGRQDTPNSYPGFVDTWNIMPRLLVKFDVSGGFRFID